MTNLQAWTLALTTVIIAGALLLEHVAFSRLAKQNRYAVGLVTELALLLAWGMILSVSLAPFTALAILAAAGLAGVPLYIVLYREQAREREQWDYIVHANRELAAELALLKAAGNGIRYSRAHNLLESVCFLHGGIAKDLADMETLVRQLRPLLGGLMPQRAEE